LPNHPITPLAHGQLNQSGDQLTIQLVEPLDLPPMIRIVWPTKPTIVPPAQYNEVASTAMRLLAEASTRLAAIRSSRRL
jgi:hypothetical protein